MAPALVIIAAGINPMKALIFSQVTLSFALPLAIIPMLLIAGQRKLMGPFVNKPLTKIVGWVIAAAIIGMNAILMFLTFSGKI